MHSSTTVVYVDGADYQGSAKIQETFVSAGNCSESVCHVGIEFHFVGQVVGRFQVCSGTLGPLSSLAASPLAAMPLLSTSQARARTQHNVFSQYNIKPT